MNKKPLLIIGSAREDSDTKKLIVELLSQTECETMDLLNYCISPFDYSANYPASDEFPKLTEKLIEADVLIFATPVYWYAMSGIMKTFFDRLTDLVTIHKTLGRKLKGKKTFLIAVGNEDQLPDGFVVPFQRTSTYFEMDFIGFHYCQCNTIQASDVFNNTLNNALKKS